MKSFIVLLGDTQSQLLTSSLLEQHVKYLDNLYRQGILILCGPFKDGTGAILIMRAQSQQDLETLLSQDPFIINHYYTIVNIHEFIEANLANNWLLNE